MRLGPIFNFLKTPIVFFALGLGFWLVQFRVIEVQNQDNYALVYLGSVKTGDQFVFHYPHIESQVYLDTVSSVELEKGYQISTNSGVFIKSELVLGRVLYIF